VIRPGTSEYPGWQYGDIVLVPDRQDRRPHNHHYYEICIVRDGVAAHCTDDFEDWLPPRTVVVITPGSVHSIYGIQDLVQTNVYYLPEWLSNDLTAFWSQEGLIPLFLSAALFPTPMADDIAQFILTEEELASVDRDIADIGEECSHEEPSLTFLNAALLKLLMKLSRAYMRQSPRDVLVGFRPQIRTALEVIEQLILNSEALSVKDLASRVALSTNHFAAVFKEVIGWTPTEYYQRRRVQHACRLLLDLKKSITDVAYELNYSDSSHFCHFFKRYRNMSPTEYRTMLSHHRHSVHDLIEH